jgi:hypothetical protein
MNVSIDYIPKNQARKIFTYAKEQLDILKNGFAAVSVIEEDSIDHTDEFEIIEVVETEEVTSFTEIMPVTPPFKIKNEPFDTALDSFKENGLAGLSQVLFESYRTIKLLDNGLILQGEYDNYKRDFDFYVAKLFSANNFCFAIDFCQNVFVRFSTDY